jgi:integrase
MRLAVPFVKESTRAAEMAKKVERLSAMAVAKASESGLYADGAGLYLRVGRGGAKSWAFRYMLGGKAREMGLGGLTQVSLAGARKKAIDVRLLLSNGIDPLVQRQDEESKRNAGKKLALARSMKFDECAEAYIRAHESSWRNMKHRKQWNSTLAKFASPVFGSIAVQDVDVALVTKVIEPIWNSKPETANRVRGRIEAVLDWAKVRGFREGENPARWRGHLDHLLPARSKIRRVKHHAALPYEQLGIFMKDLRTREGMAAAALEFLILTATRTGEVIGARWNEVDFASRVWTIPGERMKGGREHRVPLSAPALTVLERMRGQGTEVVFSGLRAGKSLSNMALLALMGRMGRGDVTAHGFRSTFRDWTAERTSFPREVAEAALAHALDDKVEAAYRRGDLFEKRRRLMDAWGEFCGKCMSPSSSAVMLQDAVGQLYTR